MSNKPLFASLLLAVVLMGLTRYALAEEKKRHVLMADYTKNGLVYTLDGRVPGEKEGLLLALGHARSADPHSEIVLLVDERAKLSDVYNLIGTVIKADYASYRVFVFDSDKKAMTELKHSRAIPFSANGSIQEQASALEKR